MSEVIASQIQQWRQLAREGKLSPTDARMAIDAIRKERIESTSVSAVSREKKAVAAAKKVPVDSDALLNQLMLGL